ncbi:hypothetical protein H0H93_009620, partial [Arthromyces matolae]
MMPKKRTMPPTMKESWMHETSENLKAQIGEEETYSGGWEDLDVDVHIDVYVEVPPSLVPVTVNEAPERDFGLGFESVSRQRQPHNRWKKAKPKEVSSCRPMPVSPRVDVDVEKEWDGEAQVQVQGNVKERKIIRKTS